MAKRFSKHISFGFKCKFHKLTCKSNKKWINDNCHASVKSIVRAQEIIVGIIAYVFVKLLSI